MPIQKRPNALLFCVLIGLACTRCSTAQADAPAPSTAHVDPWRDAEPAVAPRLELVTDEGSALPTFAQSGRVYVLGDAGTRYRIRVVNPTPYRLEAVVSVDGLDAVDGHPASLGKRGYIVPAFGEAVIDGWRTSLDTVAAFRFSSVRDSYAGRTGAARNVGVVGVAFFRERVAAALPRRAARPAAPAPAPQASPLDDRAAENDAPRAATKSEGAPAAAARPGLGTQYGETQASQVEEIEFVRADAAPCKRAELRYDDRTGLLSRGLPVPPRPTSRQDENAMRDTAQPFPESRFAQPPR